MYSRRSNTRTHSFTFSIVFCTCCKIVEITWKRPWMCALLMNKWRWDTEWKLLLVYQYFQDDTMWFCLKFYFSSNLIQWMERVIQFVWKNVQSHEIYCIASFIQSKNQTRKLYWSFSRSLVNMNCCSFYCWCWELFL